MNPGVATMGMSKIAKSAAKYLGLSLLFYPLGVASHELIGHGLVGKLCGGQIKNVEILAFRVWPRLEFVGWSGRYGECDVIDIPTRTGEALMSLGGAASTFGVAAAATALLWYRRWGGFSRPILITISLWWIDLLTYLLPSWGLPRSILWGQRTFSEPYEAAISLGMPGPLFQTMSIAGCAVLLAALIARLILDSRIPRSA